MKYKEVIKMFNNSRRELAKELDVSVQAVSKWAQTPNAEIPKVRQFQVKTILKLDD
jgi:transposase